MSSPDLQPIWEMVEEYVGLVREELNQRWNAWATTLAELEKFEVIGALLARQVTLATQLAMAPSFWNPHVGPIILRAMTDVHITLAWIFIDPVPRARQFVLYGLGQHKLYVEHLKAWAEREHEDMREVIEAMERWQSSERFEFLTEVNVGNWADTNTRKMAEECGEINLYNGAYLPFSGAVHSMWQHIARMNLTRCESPLHRLHRIPTDEDIDPDPDYLFRAARFLKKSFDRFDTATGVSVNARSGFDALCARLEAFGRQAAERHGDDPTAATEADTK